MSTERSQLTKELLLKIHKKARRYARYHKLSPEDAQDFASDLVREALDLGYVPHIRHRIIDNWRRSVKRPELGKEKDFALTGVASEPDAFSDPRKTSLRLIAAYCSEKRVDPLMRVILMLSSVLGYSYEEIELLTGISVGGLKSRVSRFQRASARDRGERVTGESEG